MQTAKTTGTPLLTDMSAVVKAIQEQTAVMERFFGLLSKDMEEIKHMLSLQPVYPMGYNVSQANYEGQMQGVVHGTNTNVLKPKSKPRPPFVPKGESVTCVRCDYEWTPQSRTPQKCPNCRSPWWYPAKFRWRKNREGADQTPGVTADGSVAEG